MSRTTRITDSFDFWLPNAPKWFRQELNRNFRQRNKRILDKTVRDGTFDENTVFIPFKKTANWFY